MGSVDYLMDRPRKRIVPQASIGAFLHFFKVTLRFAFSGCLVKNTLGTENFLCGDRDVYKRQSLQFRRRFFFMGLRLAFLRTFLLALFQPFPDGGLFLRLRRAFMVPLVAGERNISVFRKMTLFLLHGILAKRNRVDRRQKFR